MKTRFWADSACGKKIRCTTLFKQERPFTAQPTRARRADLNFQSHGSACIFSPHLEEASHGIVVTAKIFYGVACEQFCGRGQQAVRESTCGGRARAALACRARQAPDHYFERERTARTR